MELRHFAVCWKEPKNIVIRQLHIVSQIIIIYQVSDDKTDPPLCQSKHLMEKLFT